MSIVSEIRDIRMCEIARKQYEGRHLGLAFISAVRLYCVVPLTVAVVPMLVIFRGADAFNICMNTIAIMFFLDMDNFVYSHGVPYKVLEDFEANNRIDLKDDDVKMLEDTKSVHAVLIPFIILTFTYHNGNNGWGTDRNGFSQFFIYIALFNILESATGVKGKSGRCKNCISSCCTACGTCVVTLIIFVVLLVLLGEMLNVELQGAPAGSAGQLKANVQR
jgi:hypothetical protein